MSRKEELLLKISDLFSKKGYGGASIREICANLNLTSAGLYHHFKSKQEMLFEIINYPMEQALAAMRLKLPRLKDAEAKIKWIVNEQIQFYSRNRSYSKVVVDEKKSLEIQYAVIIEEKSRKYVEYIQEVVEQIIQENRHIDISPKVATFCLLGMLDNAVNWYNPEGKVSPEELASNIATIFLNGLRGEPV